MTDAAKPVPPLVRTRLSVMMLLQYAIWGAWLPLLWPFLENHRGFTGSQIGDMFAVGAVGAIVAPFIAGQIADRYFPTQWFLGISHIVGGALVWFLASIDSYWGFLAFSLAYSVIYAPTLSLTNSISFHHLPDRDRDFGKVRVWGTVGWIIVGIGIGQWLLATWTPDQNDPARGVSVVEIVDDPGANVPRAIGANPEQLGRFLTVEWIEQERGVVLNTALEALLTDAELDVPRIEVDGSPQLDRNAAVALLGLSPEEIRAIEIEGMGPAIVAGAQHAGMADAFRVSALLGVLMGLFCFTLPHTPPARGAARANAAWEAIREVRRQPLLTLFLLAVPISCVHQFYFVHTAAFLGGIQSETADQINRVFGVGGGGLMTVGQMVEIAVLALMPLVAKRLSRKTLLAAGIIAYALRMALFAYAGAISGSTGIPEVAIAMSGTALHGFCFGCFIFVAFMVVDEETTPDVRASAQSLFNLVIVGIGIIVGSKIAGWVSDWAKVDGVTDYTKLFGVPMWASIACLVVLLVMYPRRGRFERTGSEPAASGDSRAT